MPKSPSKTALAKALGLSRSEVYRLAASGMPTNSVEAAEAWRQANVNSQAAGDDIRALRAQLLRAQGEGERLKNRIREFEVQAAEQNLVPADTADQIIEVSLGPVIRALETVESQLKVKCNPSDPDHAGAALREWSVRVRKQASAALLRHASRLERKAKKSSRTTCPAAAT